MVPPRIVKMPTFRRTSSNFGTAGAGRLAPSGARALAGLDPARACGKRAGGRRDELAAIESHGRKITASRRRNSSACGSRQAQSGFAVLVPLGFEVTEASCW